jgi:hypothetical protein
MPVATTATHQGPYTVRTMRIGEGHQAQVFHGRVTIGPRHHGADAAKADRAAHAWLDARALREAQVRRESGAPSVESYREAFDVIELNDAERAMLNAHADAAHLTLTATQLAAAAGWDNWSSANLHYGRLGYKLAAAMRWTPPRRSDGSEIWTMALATGHHDIEDAQIDMDQLYASLEHAGQFEWVLRPQVAEAWSAGRTS